MIAGLRLLLRGLEGALQVREGVRDLRLRCQPLRGLPRELLLRHLGTRNAPNASEKPVNMAVFMLESSVRPWKSKALTSTSASSLGVESRRPPLKINAYLLSSMIYIEIYVTYIHYQIIMCVYVFSLCKRGAIRAPWLSLPPCSGSICCT